MRIKVLGASGSEVPGHNCPAFLVDDTLLLDAGTIGLSLDAHDEYRISHILLTHAHLDHIKAIPFLLDNLLIRNTGTTITVVSGPDVLSDLKNNIFNDRIWPDFTKTLNSVNPVLRLKPIEDSQPSNIAGYTVFMTRVNHPVPAYGFVVRNEDGTAIAYAGDTGPTDLFWERMAEHDVRCLIVEVSFPNRMEEVALLSGHLTARLLGMEIAKIRALPRKILITHIKPQYYPEIEQEVRALGMANIELLREGAVITV